MKHIIELHNKIKNSLKNEISDKYALFDLPFHSNIGDGLIWEGEIQYLKEIKSRCIYNCSYFTCEYPQLTQDVTILFHGGGNIGDLYREHVCFLQAITKKYPYNKIIVFPQTIYYHNLEILKTDMILLSQHSKLLFCVRDQRSLDLIKPFFKKKVRLIPDMAFYISPNSITPKSHSYKTTLFIKRTDNELSSVPNFPKEPDLEIKDWPTFEHKVFDGTFTFKILKKIALKYNFVFARFFLNRYANQFRKRLIQIGYDFINQYQGPIYTTRLHGCILSILMNKQVVLYDNSYGKNSEFYHTWLSDCDSVKLIEK